jgi:hypothetical protein
MMDRNMKKIGDTPSAKETTDTRVAIDRIKSNQQQNEQPTGGQSIPDKQGRHEATEGGQQSSGQGTTPGGGQGGGHVTQ